MASEAAHLLKAEHNQKFLDTLDDAYPDWLLTVGFYKAVHLAEALFARRGYHSHSHEERNRKLRAEFPAIWQEYKPLYDNSKLVRYSQRSMPAALVRSEYLGKRLVAVQQLVSADLAASQAPASGAGSKTIVPAAARTRHK